MRYVPNEPQLGKAGFDRTQAQYIKDEFQRISKTLANIDADNFSKPLASTAVQPPIIATDYVSKKNGGTFEDTIYVDNGSNVVTAQPDLVKVSSIPQTSVTTSTGSGPTLTNALVSGGTTTLTGTNLTHYSIPTTASKTFTPTDTPAGELKNGATLIESAIMGGGVSLDGVNDYVDAGTSFFNETGAFSIGIWYKKDSPIATSYILTRGDDEAFSGGQKNLGIYFRVQSTKTTGGIVPPIEGVYYKSTNDATPPPLDVYRCAVLQWDGVSTNSFNVLLDDVTATVTGSNDTFSSVSDLVKDFLFGCIQGTGTKKNFFGGEISLFRGSNTYWTTQQKTDFYNNTQYYYKSGGAGSLIPITPSSTTATSASFTGLSANDVVYVFNKDGSATASVVEDAKNTTILNDSITVSKDSNYYSSIAEFGASTYIQNRIYTNGDYTYYYSDEGSSGGLASIGADGSSLYATRSGATSSISMSHSSNQALLKLDQMKITRSNGNSLFANITDSTIGLNLETITSGDSINITLDDGTDNVNITTDKIYTTNSSSFSSGFSATGYYVKGIPDGNASGDYRLSYDSGNTRAAIETYNGSAWVAGELEVGNLIGDSQTTRDTLSGTTVDVQTLTLVKSGPDWYIEAEADGGGDISMYIGGALVTLDCTTGSGTGGKARSANIVGLGTATAPSVQYVWVSIDLGIPTLHIGSSLDRTAPFCSLAKYFFLDDAFTTTDSYLYYQRYNDASNHGVEGRGLLDEISERVRVLGPQIYSGVEGSTKITTNGGALDDLELEVSAGELYQLHEQDVIAQTVPNEYFVVNDSVTPYKKITNLNQITLDSSGDSLHVNGRHYGLDFAISKSSEGGPERIFVFLPTGSYNNSHDALVDIYNYSNPALSIEKKVAVVRCCRMVIGYTNASGGTLINDMGGTATQDNRNDPLSTTGGGSAGGNDYTRYPFIPQTVAPTPHSEGTLYYDANKHNLVMQSNHDTDLDIGRKDWLRVKNTTGTTLNHGELVYVTGSTTEGSITVANVARAKADSITTCSHVFLVTEDILDTEFGEAIRFGYTSSDIDTSTLTTGDEVYVSAATAGAWTTTKPTYPNYEYKIGKIMDVSASVGNILVQPDTTPTRDEKHLAQWTCSTADTFNLTGVNVKWKAFTGVMAQSTSLLSQATDTITVATGGAGDWRISGNVRYESAAQRIQAVVEVLVNGVSVGLMHSDSYIRNSGTSSDYWNNSFGGFVVTLADADTVKIKITQESQGVTNLTGTLVVDESLLFMEKV